MSEKVKTETQEKEPQSPDVNQVGTSEAVPKKEKTIVVVLAYGGTETQMERVWKRMTSLPLSVMTVSEEDGVQKSLAKIVADENVSDDFIFVPANIIPCKPVDLEELSVPYVYTTSRGERIYNSRVPMRFNKAHLVAFLAEALEDDEKFIHAYFDFCRHYPIEVGLNFGNFITPVNRANPCEHSVIEALVCKRFISASADGYKAISSLIEKTLLS